MRIRCKLMLFLVSLGIFTSGCGPGGEKRHEVTGTVLVDGEPAERVMVQFHSVDEEIQGDDRYPVGLTDQNGSFRLGDKSRSAGAVEGSYRVTFSWLSSDGLDAIDKLRGKYANEGSSQFTVRVPVEQDLQFSLTR